MMVEQCIGLDDKKASVNPIIEHVSWKKAWYLDVEISNATELLDPEGILIFKYKRDIPAEWTDKPTLLAATTTVKRGRKKKEATI